MGGDYTSVERCNCKANERAERRILEIRVEANNAALEVIDRKGNMHKGERVTKGQVVTQCGRSFEELLKLGTGLHSICYCRTIGPPDSVSKARED